MGKGTLFRLPLLSDSDPDWIPILDGGSIQTLIKSEYPHVKDKYLDSSYLQNLELYPKNDDLEEINTKMLNALPRNCENHLSADSSSHCMSSLNLDGLPSLSCN